MNVLFISLGNYPDYQCDVLFHGLNQLPSVTVYSTSEMWYMFEGNEPAEVSKLYGKGFSLYNRLNINNKRFEDASTVSEKIKSKFYDRIVYGQIHRCSDYLDEVLKTYAKHEIVFVDGEDFDFSLRFNFQYWRRLINIHKYYRIYLKAIRLSDKGIYFKRELRNCDRKYFYPISFAIPESNIITSPFPDKIKEQATIVPGNPNTYIYDVEKDYYEGYATSVYAVTTKKAGWDCLRHYEILANRCIPYFPKIEKCPEYTMHLFPKTLIKETNKLIETNRLTQPLAELYTHMYYNITKDRLTTKMLAKYVLSMVT